MPRERKNRAVKPLKSVLQRRAIELGEHILADVDLVFGSTPRMFASKAR
jgi:hypothetical protein